jgi:pepF/M3 family oligoendopeptidase
MPTTQEKLPHWDVSNVYPAIESPKYQADLDKVVKMLDELDSFIKKNKIRKLTRTPSDIQGAAVALDELIGRINEITLTFGTLEAYIYSFYSTDSYNKEARKRLSELEQITIRINRNWVRFQAWVGSLGKITDDICKVAPKAKEHRLSLDFIVEQSRYLMDSKFEDLASELSLSGGGVMWKLQSTTTSQLKMPFEREGKTEELPMTILRNLASDKDPDVRKRAYETEIEGWKRIRESVAFALNGVKGNAITLAKWRGRDDVLHGALDHNRIDRETLEALLQSMRDSFPSFRSYLKSKAKKLGKDKLPWWDLFAPVGEIDLKYTWSEASDYIVEQFSTFSNELGDFARSAFDHNWIDAEPRDGKVGGAFCMGVPAVEESRILANFDGSFDQLTTLAHELGHGYHNFCQKGLPMMRRGAPMTLAETASIFCETIVFDAALATAPEETQVAILENQLIGATQVIVDIYSRFIFESEIIKRREKSELSVDDFCEVMLNAQKETYGDGLDENNLHSYMWLLKPHYYYADAHFYNYPYAFGLLFGLGMFAIYQREGESFIPRYKELLRNTGEGKVADLASSFDINVKTVDFWKNSIAILEERVEKYRSM